MVEEFHKTFEHPVGLNSAHKEPLNIRQLRIKLLFEELTELAEAGDVKATLLTLCSDYITEIFDKNGGVEDADESKITFKEMLSDREISDGDNVNKIEELDALADIMYVLCGKILTSGLHNVFERSFLKVHQNNMSKAHFTEEHAKETLENSLSGKGSIVTKEIAQQQHDGSYLSVPVYIVLNESKKVIKPWNHKKVELTLAEE